MALFLPRRWAQPPQFGAQVELDEKHPLSDKAEAFLPFSRRRVAVFGSPQLRNTPNGRLVGGTSSAFADTLIRPEFAKHDGDFTVTFLAASGPSFTRAFVAGYNYSSGSTEYGIFTIALHKRADGAFDQRGSFNVTFNVTRSSFAAAVNIGYGFDSTTTDHPFYNPYLVRCVSVACLGSSSSDLRAVVDGRIDNSGMTRSGAQPATTLTTTRSGFGYGAVYRHSTNALAETGNGNFVGLVVFHRRKLTFAEQSSLTRNPWQIFRAANSPVFYSLPSAAPGTFQPYFARNANSVIGASFHA